MANQEHHKGRLVKASWLKMDLKKKQNETKLESGTENVSATSMLSLKKSTV